MKKVKMLFVIAAFLGIFSSFAFRAKTTGDIYVKEGSEFVLKSSANGLCVPEVSSACEYELREGHEPETEADFIYDVQDNVMWEPAP